MQWVIKVLAQGFGLRTLRGRFWLILSAFMSASLIWFLCALIVVEHQNWRKRMHEATGVLEQIKTKQKEHLERFGYYASASANPQGEIQSPSCLETLIMVQPVSRAWDTTQEPWNTLGVEPGERMEFQLETRGGRGVCLPKPGLDATCSRVPVGDWFWATAEFPTRTVIVNNALSDIWVVEKDLN